MYTNKGFLTRRNQFSYGKAMMGPSQSRPTAMAVPPQNRYFGRRNSLLNEATLFHQSLSKSVAKQEIRHNLNRQNLDRVKRDVYKSQDSLTSRSKNRSPMNQNFAKSERVYSDDAFIRPPPQSKFSTSQELSPQNDIRRPPVQSNFTKSERVYSEDAFEKPPKKVKFDKSGRAYSEDVFEKPPKLSKSERVYSEDKFVKAPVSQNYYQSERVYSDADFRQPKRQHQIIRRPPALNRHKTNAIFEIYVSSGYVYADYKRKAGMGFMITQSLAITTHFTIPNEDNAARAFAVFLDSPKVAHKFLPQNFFFTHRDLNFTILEFGFASTGEVRVPLPLHNNFELKDDSYVVFFVQGKVKHKKIVDIDSDMFCYATGKVLPSGLPIFDYNWELQGMHHTSTSSYKINQATRVDSIWTFLKGVTHILRNDELLNSLMNDPMTTVAIAAHPMPKQYQSQHMYWFQWFTRNIFRYDTKYEIWSRVLPANCQELESISNWYFLWNSRICTTSSGNIVIIGGVADQFGNVKSEAWLYRTGDNTLHKLPNMKFERDAPAVVSHGNHVFVLGGRPKSHTCEQFSFDQYEWESIPNMLHGRYEHSAVLMQNQNYIYAAGGLPYKICGRSVERYSLLTDHWEMLLCALPENLHQFVLFPVTQTKMGIFGGNDSNRAYIMDINETGRITDDRDTDHYLYNEKDNYSIYRIADVNHDTPILFPPLYSIENDVIYIMTGRHGYEKLQVIPYNYSNCSATGNPHIPRKYGRVY